MRGAPNRHATLTETCPPLASSSGFPFKVVPLEGTLSDSDVYGNRKRIVIWGVSLPRIDEEHI